MPKITIRPKNISEGDHGAVVFENPVLRNLLVQKQADALYWLATRATPVNLSSITIDDHGRVVISDSDFAKVIAEKLATGRATEHELSDTVCSNGSC